MGVVVGSVCLSVRMYVILCDKSKVIKVTKFGAHEDVEASWCGYDFGSQRSKVKVACPKNGWAMGVGWSL